MHDQGWTKVWTTEYSLFSVWLFGREFTEISQRELGTRFNEVIFLVENVLATTFRKDEELKKFGKDIAQKIIDDPGFADEMIKTLKDIEEGFEKLYKLSPEEFLNSDNLQEFLNLHYRFLPYYVSIIWAPNALNEFEISESERKRIFTLCEETRKATEPFYPRLEKFIQKVFKYISKKEGCNEKLLRALLPEELEEYIKEKKLPAEETLKERYAYSAVKCTFEHNELYTGETAQKLIGEITHIEKGDMKEVSGVLAMPGKVTGIVKKVFNNDDLEKLNEGEILVTTMTRPEWVAGMKKAAAFVTDAGGILCHAAIVAREMNKPCIIGTKIATQIFKDGDTVEVDANKGIVKIL